MTKNIYISQEAYKDQYKIDVEKAFDICNSMEAVFTMYENNLNTKLNMLSKINKVYGKSSRGIENYCRIQSLEADAPDTNSSTTSTDSSNTNSSSTDNSSSNNQQATAQQNEKKTKTMEMLHKVHETIMNLITKLFQWIMDLINKFRYNNQVFENTINLINGATQEEINKVSDDLKNVEFDGKDLLLMSKHPQENLNKYIGSYQLLSDTFGNAIQASMTDAKNLTKIKDFSVKFKEFVKNVPDVGNACPTLEGEGADTLKQYEAALKSFCNQSLNYKNNPKSFNSYYGGTDTFTDKVTVGKIIGNVDPKSVINLIKTETEAIGKLNEGLKKINDSNKKNGKDISTAFNKQMHENGKDQQTNEAAQAQARVLTTAEKALTQINSIFCGICSNSIRSLNVVKGKLIDFSKKNISTNKDKPNLNETNNNENNNTNTKKKSNESYYVDYQFDNFMKSLEHLQDLQFTEMYSIEDADLNTINVESKIHRRSPLVVIKELFKKIWRSLVNFVTNIIQKISEVWGEFRLTAAQTKNDNFEKNEVRRKQRRAVLDFAEDAQELIKRMNKTVISIDRINDEMQKSFVKRQGKTETKNDTIFLWWTSRCVFIMKLFVLLEKLVYKAFTRYRNFVISGKIKIVKSGTINEFASKFEMIARRYETFYRKMDTHLGSLHSKDVIDPGVDEIDAIIKEVDTLFTKYTDTKILADISIDNGKVASTNINIIMDKIEQAINTPEIQDKIGLKLFGVIIDKTGNQHVQTLTMDDIVQSFHSM